MLISFPFLFNFIVRYAGSASIALPKLWISGSSALDRSFRHIVSDHIRIILWDSRSCFGRLSVWPVHRICDHRSTATRALPGIGCDEHSKWTGSSNRFAAAKSHPSREDTAQPSNYRLQFLLQSQHYPCTQSKSVCKQFRKGNWSVCFSLHPCNLSYMGL